MQHTNGLGNAATRHTRQRIEPGQLSIENFRQLIGKKTDIDDWPLASFVEQNALVYNASELLPSLLAEQPETSRSDQYAATEQTFARLVMAEWSAALSEGPGIIVIREAFAQHQKNATENQTLDHANNMFNDLIETEKTQFDNQGDHFAKPGANDRVWNALEKHCMANTGNFIDYYKNPFMHLASTAWLGPNYQTTAQINRVNPGGEAQKPHRDYHLGFMSTEQAARYPLRAHLTSPNLTLQGAIAHCDMPIESGPTLYLPYSHIEPSGYVEFHRPEFQEYFEKHKAQFELKKGDLVFFNPALMHAAGNNKTTDIYRMANLVQVSSAFGRSIESVDRTRMLLKMYPELLARTENGQLSPLELESVLSASANGYPFPTNLDLDQPVDGLIPQSQLQLVSELIAKRKTLEEAKNLLLEADKKKQSN